MKKGYTKEDFYNKLKIMDNGCWEWTGSRHVAGYGMTRIDGKLYRCNRVALELEGIDLTNKIAMHTCDNPPCCNPAHLIAGTMKDNMEDRNNKERQAKGIDLKHSKLTEEQIVEIRALWASGTMTQTDIGFDYGVHQGTISYLVNNKTWKHIK
jgi:hypothetical protein